MEISEMRSLLGEASRSNTYFELFAQVTSIVDEIDIAVQNNHERILEENINNLFELIIESLKEYKVGQWQGELAAEILSSATHPILMKETRARFPDLIRFNLHETHFTVVSSLLNCAAFLNEFDDGEFLSFLRSLFLETTNQFRPLAEYFEPCAQEIQNPDERISRIEDFSNVAQQYLDKSHDAISANVTTAKPGDVLFRELGNRYGRHFGHTGIYLGPNIDSTDTDEIDNHLVIEMEPWIHNLVNLPINCRIHTVGHFRSQGAFLGAYTSNLSSVERLSIVKTALSYVNQCRYGVVAKNYKNPAAKRFRCDGFVEHCYEVMSPMSPHLVHRGGSAYAGGLFEDDTYDTLSPNSLRSCLFEKIANF